MFSWTGFYIGAQVGALSIKAGLNGNMDVEARDDGPYPWSATNSWSQVFAGGHVGYDFQMGRIIIGLEGDVNARFGDGNPSFSRGLSEDFIGSNFVGGWQAQAKWDASIRGRLGALVTERALVYVTGGVAFAEFSLSHADLRGRGAPANATWGTVNVYGDSRVGWTIGAGAQYALDPNWSVRIEYRHTDYGTKSQSWGRRENWFYRTEAGNASAKITDDRVAVGMSYRFGGPVVARY